MHRNAALAMLASLIMVSAGTTAWAAAPPPSIERSGSGFELKVDGKPFIVLGGELHNSTASSSSYMASVWDRLQAQHLNTVVSPAYWELVEPEEGRFDFGLIDEQIREARARNIHLVLLWFGTLKNAQSSYAPAWVRADQQRFPRARINAKLGSPRPRDQPISLFGEAVLTADARAFAALMAHVAEVDPRHTVIAVQVENETGILGDSRDRSPAAEAAWRDQVPGKLMDYLATHRQHLSPSLDEVWKRGGHRRTGRWAEVFGDDWQADEVFMAWRVSQFVDRVAAAGREELAVPMYANAWLGPQKPTDIAGVYPSGGPIPRVFDIWRAGAPHLNWLSPDIYDGDFDGWAAQYSVAGNPLFIPETRFVLGNLFTALGSRRAIGFCPFGIENGLPDNQIAQAYAQLGGMMELVARAQTTGAVAGFALAPGQTANATFGDYVVTVRSGADALRSALLDVGVTLPESHPTQQAQNDGAGMAELSDLRATGLVIQSARDEFVVVGKDLDIQFTRPGQAGAVELERVEEGHFLDGRWEPGRVINGDERLQFLPSEAVGTVRIKLLRPTTSPPTHASDHK